MPGRRAWLALLALAAALSAQQAPRIFYSKSFPGSSPPYCEITLDQNGQASYRETKDDDDPLRFELPAADTREIFALAEKLQFFRVPLESKARGMARMGQKTFRYQGGETPGEVEFNYSENPDARALTDWFEKIGETSRHRSNLERAAQFDRLGINKALLLLEADLDRNRVAGPEQLLPVLDKIAAGKNYLHMAQARAASLAERIRAGKRAGR